MLGGSSTSLKFIEQTTNLRNSIISNFDSGSRSRFEKETTFLDSILGISEKLRVSPKDKPTRRVKKKAFFFWVEFYCVFCFSVLKILCKGITQTIFGWIGFEQNRRHQKWFVFAHKSQNQSDVNIASIFFSSPKCWKGFEYKSDSNFVFFLIKKKLKKPNPKKCTNKIVPNNCRFSMSPGHWTIRRKEQQQQQQQQQQQLQQQQQQ